MWFRIILTSCGLALVLYFQFFFDFKAYTSQELSKASNQSENATE